MHTVYPVLLASADFNDWWVVADRRHAYPQPFWRARTSQAWHQLLRDPSMFVPCCLKVLSHVASIPQAGHAYTYTSDTCIAPPATPDAISETTSGQYVLACVVWSPTSFAELEQMAELPCPNFASHCFWGPIQSYQLSGHRHF